MTNSERFESILAEHPELFGVALQLTTEALASNMPQAEEEEAEDPEREMFLRLMEENPNLRQAALEALAQPAPQITEADLAFLRMVKDLEQRPVLLATLERLDLLDSFLQVESEAIQKEE